jgi:hypothetical protein
MFMVPDLRARPPIREAITKMYTYHLDRAPGLATKTLSLLGIKKKLPG